MQCCYPHQIIYLRVPGYLAHAAPSVSHQGLQADAREAVAAAHSNFKDFWSVGLEGATVHCAQQRMTAPRDQNCNTCAHDQGFNALVAKT
eukprot:3940543-Amphidinium_carterae.1